MIFRFETAKGNIAKCFFSFGYLSWLLFVIISVVVVTNITPLYVKYSITIDSTTYSLFRVIIISNEIIYCEKKFSFSLVRNNNILCKRKEKRKAKDKFI